MDNSHATNNNSNDNAPGEGIAATHTSEQLVVKIDTALASAWFIKMRGKPEVIDDPGTNAIFKAVHAALYDSTSYGAGMIVVERERQIKVEGWTLNHDADHVYGELADAACCYIVAATSPRQCYDLPDAWPWEGAYWKPGTPIRMLVKAGALIAAEIDRRLARGEKK